MNNYNKFNNQQNSEESTLAETILLAGSGLFLIWVGAATLPVMSILGFVMVGTALIIRKRENMKIEVKQLGIPKFVRVNVIKGKNE